MVNRGGCRAEAHSRCDRFSFRPVPSVLRQRFSRRSERISGMRPGPARRSRRVRLSETEEGREAPHLISRRKRGRVVRFCGKARAEFL